MSPDQNAGKYPDKISIAVLASQQWKNYRLDKTCLLPRQFFITICLYPMFSFGTTFVMQAYLVNRGSLHAGSQKKSKKQPLI